MIMNMDRYSELVNHIKRGDTNKTGYRCRDSTEKCRIWPLTAFEPITVAKLNILTALYDSENPIFKKFLVQKYRLDMNFCN